MSENVGERYIAYLKDNPEGYWFKRKLYGWGWTPATWQGWLVLIIFLALLVLNTLRFNPEAHTDREVLTEFIPQTVVLILVLIVICYKTGEKPKWQWGLPKE